MSGNVNQKFCSRVCKKRNKKAAKHSWVVVLSTTEETTGPTSEGPQYVQVQANFQKWLEKLKKDDPKGFVRVVKRKTEDGFVFVSVFPPSVVWDKITFVKIVGPAFVHRFAPLVSLPQLSVVEFLKKPRLQNPYCSEFEPFDDLEDAESDSSIDYGDLADLPK